MHSSVQVPRRPPVWVYVSIHVYPLDMSANLSSMAQELFNVQCSSEREDEELVKVGFVGAGGVSFGTKEGPMESLCASREDAQRAIHSHRRSQSGTWPR